MANHTRDTTMLDAVEITTNTKTEIVSITMQLTLPCLSSIANAVMTSLNLQREKITSASSPKIKLSKRSF